MPTKPTPSPAAAELRRCAEARLKEQHLDGTAVRSEADTQRLVHELQVHQIELEMQNEELQASRDKLEASVEKFSDLYDFAPVGYLTLDREGTICEANLAAASLLGMERSRLVQRRLGLSVGATDLRVFNAFLAKVFESKVRESCELRLLTSGQPGVEVRIEATVAATGRECRAVLEDITQQKRAEQDRLILNKLESTGILAGGIAHDFNNLLTVILLHIDLAQMNLPPGGDSSRHLELAGKAVGMARGLTQQLIVFASGGGMVRKVAALPSLIQEYARPALSGSRVRCEFSLPQNLWPAAVDEGQFGQVIRNLVLNAREAMPQGGMVSVGAENLVLGAEEIPSLPPGAYVRVSVTDEGVGIAKEVQAKIFDPYFSTKQRGEQRGMGLGLTICHTIVQKHGGAMAVESEVGAGTTFRVYLPASREVVGKEVAPGPKALPCRGRILVMDDEDGLRTVLEMSLQRMGLEVELARHGQEAVEAYQRAKNLGRPFDVVLLDLTVRAGLGGEEALEALLKMDPAVKAVVMSGYADHPVLQEPARYGFKGVVAKPFDTDELNRVLARVMEPDSTKTSDRLSVISDPLSVSRHQ